MLILRLKKHYYKHMIKSNDFMSPLKARVLFIRKFWIKNSLNSFFEKSAKIELKSVCSSTSEEKQKIEKEFFDQREQRAEFENGNAQKERALLEKIKTIESEQNQLRSSYQTLKRYEVLWLSLYLLRELILYSKAALGFSGSFQSLPVFRLVCRGTP